MYFSLLKEWCDALLEYQITEMKQPELYGGILCPSCIRVHGRCSDAIFPLLFMADRTGEEKYLTAARRLFSWMECMLCADGSYYNDTNSSWKGITVFTVIQLAEAIHHFEYLLAEEEQQKWRERLSLSAEYLYLNIDRIGGNINYPVTCSYALSLSGRVLGRTEYRQKAKQLARRALDFFTADGLLFGEGKLDTGGTPKQCYPVDIGYNVEESLPALLAYAKTEGDTKVYEQAVASMRVHLQFMLPDGAWDNSFGTRNNKWSYWGSRTSDGCQMGYAYAAGDIPEYGAAVFYNTRLLKDCTSKGILHGGPMFDQAGVRPCIHHTFCHAKALAAMLLQGPGPEEEPGAGLPREEEYGVRTFPSLHVNLIARGGWRATISDYDCEYSREGHATGGALTMLWHQQTGAVCVGTMGRYELVEPNNMQLPPVLEDICQTPRIEYQEAGRQYRSINDKAAEVTIDQQDETITAAVTGTLRDADQNGCSGYQISYEFNESELIIKAAAEWPQAELILPVIVGAAADIRIEGRRVRIPRGESEITLQFSNHVEQRGLVFNPVGGFITAVLGSCLGESLEVKLEVIRRSNF